MALTIRKENDPILLERCKLMLGIPSQEFISNMFKLMAESGGIGLSANQVGVKQKFFIMKVEKPIVFMNPRIVHYFGKKIEGQEGCLSYPEHYETKGRYAKIRVEFVDMSGMLRKREFTGLEARVIQHEMDHLHGILFKLDQQSL